MWKTFKLMWKTLGLMWKTRPFNPQKISFFRARSFFAPKGATPLLLMNWKGYGFFRARLKKVTDFFFNCVHSKQLHI
nr:MAG TPA: hypothetical protein [Caudoviricetes sp.]